jgi:hypothetical protein
MANYTDYLNDPATEGFHPDSRRISAIKLAASENLNKMTYEEQMDYLQHLCDDAAEKYGIKLVESANCTQCAST